MNIEESDNITVYYNINRYIWVESKDDWKLIETFEHMSLVEVQKFIDRLDEEELYKYRIVKIESNNGEYYQLGSVNAEDYEGGVPALYRMKLV